MQFEKQKNKDKIDQRDMDKLVANNLKKKRIILGLSRTEVAKAVGINVQQVQKCESNIDHNPSKWLHSLISFLKTPIYQILQLKN